MSYNSSSEGSIVLRLEFSIADAVHQRGLFAVLGAAIAAWWNRPRLPPALPAHLRADVGLPPDPAAAIGLHALHGTPMPVPLRRPGM